VLSDTGGALRIGAPQRLCDFAARQFVTQSNVFAYSPHPDGRRFLVNALTDPGEQTVNVITNWQKAVTTR